MLLLATKDLGDYFVQGADGDLGRVDGFTFNPDTWDLEYIVANRSKWFLQTEFFLLPIRLLEQPDTHALTISTRLNEEDARNLAREGEDNGQLPHRIDSPLNYWRAGRYHRGFLWLDPLEAKALVRSLGQGENGSRPSQEEEHPAMKRSTDLIGYQVTARGKPLGKIDDLIVDAVYWNIRYMIIDGADSKIMMPSQWIRRFDPVNPVIDLNLERDLVLASPYVLY